MSFKNVVFCMFALSVLMLTGCVAMVSDGAKIVDAGYKPPKVLVSYRIEGVAPPRVSYFLIEEKEGEAIFERSDDGSGTLFKVHWKDDQGDHFSAWMTWGTHIAWEFIVPFDRTQAATKLSYPTGSYDIVELEGMERPVKRSGADNVVVTKLIPK